MRLRINSTQTLSSAIGKIRKEFEEHKYLTVSVMTGKKRTLGLNALSHVWYTQIALEEGEFTEGEVKCLCKYHRGLPILRGEDEEFNYLCEKVIDPLPYENRIKAMEYLDVTSLMNTKQFCRYMDAVQKNYIGRVELAFPDES